MYSIDEVFIDASDYLKTYKLSPREMTMMLIQDVLTATGVTATAGIGTNLYLAKVAMDIQAKRIAPDKDGVRIAELAPPGNSSVGRITQNEAVLRANYEAGIEYGYKFMKQW